MTSQIGLTRDKDPFTFYEELRGLAPVIWDSDLNSWLVTSYELCVKVLQNEELYERADKLLPGGTGARGDVRNLAVITGDDQLALHRFLARPLTGQKCRVYQKSIIAPIVSAELERLEGRDTVDLASEYVDRIPTRVGLALIGFDIANDQLVERIRLLKATISEWHDLGGLGSDATSHLRSTEAASELHKLIMPFVLDRKEQRRDDLASHFWNEGPSVFDDWGADDVNAACHNYLSGGETVYALRNMLHLILTDEALKERLTRDLNATVPIFVEEVLRIYGVLHWPIRFATSDTALGGTGIKKGDLVAPLIAAPGRDEDLYTDPDFIVLESERRPIHLAFGSGPRYCIGAALARAECVETVTTLLRRYPEVRLDPTLPPPDYRGFRLRSYLPLNAALPRI